MLGIVFGELFKHPTTQSGTYHMRRITMAKNGGEARL